MIVAFTYFVHKLCLLASIIVVASLFNYFILFLTTFGLFLSALLMVLCRSMHYVALINRCCSCLDITVIGWVDVHWHVLLPFLGLDLEIQCLVSLMFFKRSFYYYFFIYNYHINKTNNQLLKKDKDKILRFEVQSSILTLLEYWIPW